MTTSIVPAEELPHLTRRERQHVAHLRRRRDFLAERVQESYLDLSWDKAEMSALDWALSILEQPSSTNK